jgi:hypothetical protein
VAATCGFGICLLAQLVPDMRGRFDRDTVAAIAAGQFGYLISTVLAAWLTSYVSDVAARSAVEVAVLGIAKRDARRRRGRPLASRHSTQDRQKCGRRARIAAMARAGQAAPLPRIGRRPV